VERVTFHSEETGFCVLRLKVRGSRELLTVVGCLPHVVPGEWVRARGEWVMNREHGRQLQAVELQSMPPESREGIEKFLGSGLIKGIGPVYARKLVEHFGQDIFKVIEHESARLESVEGIGRIRRQRIKDSWVEGQAVRAIMAFLLAHGVSTTRAFRIHKTYGDKAIPTVRDDPYCLARDIRGIGFKLADAVAEKLGIEKTSDIRARAGVEHVLLETTGEGHCALPREALIEKAAAILEIPVDIIERAVDHGLAGNRLVEESIHSQHQRLIYLQPLHWAETRLVAHMKLLARGRHPLPAVDADKAVAWCEAQVGLALAPMQREALRLSFSRKVLILTGGPGVGKTTLVNAMIRVMVAKRLQVVLCAPTGRAAKRLTETTGREARTIHRLLAFDPRTGRFRHDDENPLEGDVFIVDETSMLDLTLAWQLIRAIPSRAALVLVGDVDQLPSVGPGCVLRDLIDSACLPVCRLNHVFRQAAASHIVTNAHRVNAGHLPEPGEQGGTSDFFLVEEEDPEKAVAIIVKLIRTNIPRAFHLDPTEDVQVLTPMRRGLLGSQNLNLQLQQALNPHREGVERYGNKFFPGDKVMQVENNYDKEVFNGDIGRIVRLNTEEREVTVRFDGREVLYDLHELDELVPSYAVTIHKSQGSEYPCVVIPVHTQHYIMLQRNLIYTGITRGRKLVVLVGTQRALAIAVGRVGAHQRITTLRERLEAVFLGARPDSA